MDIRLLEQRDIQEAKELWKKVFEDGDEFLDFYFNNKILPGNSLGMFDGGLISVLHMIPYKIRVQGRAVKTAFIAGAATAKRRRKQGLMKKMLHESLELMRSRGILLTHLYPFLHSFYEQYGWATYSYVDKMKATDGKESYDVAETDDISLLHSLYHNFTKGMSGYVIRAEKEWKWRMDDLFSDGGKVLLLKEEDVPVCYMMYYVEDGKAEVIETVYDKPKHAKQLAEHLAASYSEVKYKLLSQNVTSSPNGMARVVDAKKLLCEFDVEDILDKVTIRDDFASWNNVGSGKYEMDIKELAKLIHMGAERAFNEKSNVMERLQNINIKPSFTCILKNTDRIIAMWGIFVGIAIGAGQIIALKALIGLIMGDRSTALKLLAVLLIIIKIAVIVLILYLLSTVSLVHVIWAAGGMLVGLIALSAVLTLRRKKTEKDEHINREHA